MSTPTPNDLFRACQKLIKAGQPVFPCRANGDKAKQPMTKNGLLDATLDLAQVKAWWLRHGDAAIGIRTGVLWDVLDVDTKHGVDGRAHLHGLQELGLLNGCKRVVLTPSGGLHLYFRPLPGQTNHTDNTLGLDVRTHGGYVLAPPSYIASPKSTGSYTELDPPVGGNTDPLLWDCIVGNLRPMNSKTKAPVFLLPSERRASVGALREFVSTLKEGERNQGLYWAICRCIENNIDPHELVEAATLTGLTEDEILLSVTSAIRRAGFTDADLDTEAEALFPTT